MRTSQGKSPWIWRTRSMPPSRSPAFALRYAHSLRGFYLYPDQVLGTGEAIAVIGVFGVSRGAEPMTAVQTLGRFADCRLDQAGLRFWSAGSPSAACACAAWAAIAPARCASGAF